MASSFAGGWMSQVRGLRLQVPGTGNFFRYHGALAPGVRLLRVLPFSLKAAIVALCFLVPIGLLSALHLSSVRDLTRQTTSERVGLALVSHATVLSQALQAGALDLAVGSIGGKSGAATDWEAGVDTGFKALSAAVGGLRYATGLTEAMRKVQLRHDELRSGDTSDVARRLRLLQAYQTALHSLVMAMSADFSLSVDPQVEAAHLRQLALVVLPQLSEALAGLRSAGAGAMTNPASQAWRDNALQQWTTTRLALDTAPSYLGPLVLRAFAAATPLSDEAIWKPIRDFVESASNALQGPQAAGEPAAFLAEGGMAVKAAEKARGQALQALDAVLQAREAQLHSHVKRLAWGLGACLVLALYTLLSVYRVMDGGLQLIRSQVLLMAKGDLSARPAPRGRDEVAAALGSLGQSLSKLADLFAAVRQGVAAMSHASHSMTTGTNDLRRRTEEAAQATSEIIQGITLFVDQMEDSGRRIDDAMNVVQTLRVDALRSHNQMQRLDDRMKLLKGKSRKIGDIVEVIDHIAFRTNILSLNAAVEAAKAGPAGRGFAVVAQEVRSLAQRTAESARQVGGIISSSTEDIEQCSAMADMSSEALADTQRNVLRISQSMDEIVALTRQGLTNSQAIMQQLMNVDSMTGDNHNLVGQMATASDDLSRQGDHLSEKVTGFKLV